MDYEIREELKNLLQAKIEAQKVYNMHSALNQTADIDERIARDISRAAALQETVRADMAYEAAIKKAVEGLRPFPTNPETKVRTAFKCGDSVKYIEQ